MQPLTETRDTFSDTGIFSRDFREVRKVCIILFVLSNAYGSSIRSGLSCLPTSQHVTFAKIVFAAALASSCSRIIIAGPRLLNGKVVRVAKSASFSLYHD